MDEKLQEVWLAEGFREPYREVPDSYYYICGGRYTEDEIATMTLTELGMRRMGSMPSRLYKYYSNTTKDNVNHSLESLQNGTVYLQEASKFDDNYDCILTMNEEEFFRIRIEHYAKICKVCIKDDWSYEECAKEFADYIYKHCDSIDKIINIFGNNLSDNRLDKNCELFALRLENAMMKYYNEPNIWSRAFYEALHSEFLNMHKVTERFRIACFTTSPYMINMWSSYADMHKGFCIEYSMPDILHRNDNLSPHLYPVIYSDARNSVLQKCMEELDVTPDEEYLGAIYKYGILAKSKSLWKNQNEWRLISYDNMLAEDYNCKFYPISKVYLGQKMPIDQREEIIGICKTMGIPCVGVIQSNERYKMIECNI